MTVQPEDQERAGVSLARYADISAEIRLLGRARAAEVLTRAGVSADAWSEADASWKAAIDADLDGKHGLLVAFARRFSRSRRQLASAAAVDARTAETPAMRTDVVVPTYLQSPAAEAPPAIAAPPLMPPPVVSPPSSLAATAALDLHAIVSRVLPFAAGKGSSQGAEGAPLAGTLPLSEAAPAEPGSSTPAFQSAPQPPAASSSAPARERSPLAETADLDLRHIVSKIMPFSPQSTPSQDPSRASALAASTSSPPTPNLTLEQYASFVAEILSAPERAGATRTKYGVPTEQAHHALGALRERRFSEDRALKERHLRLVAEYRAWLARSR